MIVRHLSNLLEDDTAGWDCSFEVSGCSITALLKGGGSTNRVPEPGGLEVTCAVGGRLEVEVGVMSLEFMS
jgi:hypothetical protein